MSLRFCVVPTGICQFPSLVMFIAGSRIRDTNKTKSQEKGGGEGGGGRGIIHVLASSQSLERLIKTYSV